MFDITLFLERALGSELFAGAGLIAAFGFAIATLRRIVLGAWAAALRRLSASVTIDSRSPAYRHLWLWVDETGVLRHVRRMRTGEVHRGTSGDTLVPAPGTHWFVRGGRLCTLTRRIGKEQPHARPLETVEITVLGGGLSVVRGWLTAGARLAAEADRRGPRLHVLSHGYWDDVGPLPQRALATVLCDDDRIERLAADLRRFTGAREWYAMRGVPWRRGYLLHGPPGTGKSSVIRALACEVGLDVASVDLGRPSLSDDGLREALFGAPARSILVMEDIDALFDGRDREGRGISFSGLLNAIDGIGAQEGRALMMTSNHPERLDPALTRPGRADLHVELGPVTGRTAARLFARFFPGEAALAARFERAIGSARVAPAEVQGWLLRHADDASAASRWSALAAPE